LVTTAALDTIAKIRRDLHPHLPPIVVGTMWTWQVTPVLLVVLVAAEDTDVVAVDTVEGTVVAVVRVSMSADTTVT
jgi:hypothetical protein